MNEHTLWIPWLGPTLNQIWAGMHWSKRRKIAQDAHNACMTAQNVRPMLAPVSLTFQPQHGHKSRRRLDCSNYAASCKALEDGLVQAGILPGDSFDEVVSVQTLQPIKGDETGMWITIKEQQA